MRGPSKRVPAEPLVKWVSLNTHSHGKRGPASGGTTLHDRVGQTMTDAFYRAQRSGWISEKAADQFAGALHMHPSEIWHDWYELTGDV